MHVQHRIFVGMNSTTAVVELDTNGQAYRVTIGSDGTEDDVSLPSELVERVAVALRHVRARLHDNRAVCPDHGYYDGERCIRCEEHEAAQRAREKLNNEQGD